MHRIADSRVNTVPCKVPLFTDIVLKSSTECPHDIRQVQNAKAARTQETTTRSDGPKIVRTEIGGPHTAAASSRISAAHGDTQATSLCLVHGR